MRIAVTNPTDWPYLRRGVERFINELGAYLARRGHDVTVISAKPGRAQAETRDGFTARYYRRLWHPSFAKWGVLEFHAFFVPALYDLLRHRYDVVLSCTFMDGLAARLARGITGTPYVFSAFAIPPRAQHFRSLTTKGAIFRHVTLQADAFTSLSQYTRAYYQDRWGRKSAVIPVPVDFDRFRPMPRRPGAPPTILCAAALDDPRKGGRVLMRAFDRLKHKRPDLQMQIAWSLDPAAQKEFTSLVAEPWRKDIQFLGTGVDLAQLYAQASLSVLPSLWEAQGLVAIEALAAGTPVVCTRDGAFPEFVTDPRIGRLFDPGNGTVYEPTNIDGLVRALDECLELSRSPETAGLCRAAAWRYSWDAVGPVWENMLETVARKSTPAAEALECRG